MRNILAAMMVAATLTGAAFASDGTVGKTVREQFTVDDLYGRPRTGCKLSLLSGAAAYRDGTPASISGAFRNYSTGMYELRWTPSQAGEYAGFVSYSGIRVSAWTKTVRAHDTDTLHAALSATLTAVKAKTDNLPAEPSAAGDAMTLTPAYDAAMTAASQASVTALGSPSQASALSSHDTDMKSAVASAHAVTDALVSGIDDDPWDDPVRTVTGGSVDTAAAVVAPVDITAQAAGDVDTLLTFQHGAGLWSAAGSVVVVPFQGTVSHEAAARAKDVHVVRGDSVAVPYDLDVDLTGWDVWFGAKANPADEAYAVGPLDITAYVTDAPNGGGLINLTPEYTAVVPRRYFAEIELRKTGEVNTPLRFYLWVDADVVR